MDIGVAILLLEMNRIEDQFTVIDFALGGDALRFEFTDRDILQLGCSAGRDAHAIGRRNVDRPGATHDTVDILLLNQIADFRQR